MAETKTITFKPNIFSKEHRLTLDPEFIELYKSTYDTEPLRFSKLEIDSIRYSIRRLSINTTYQIDIKSSEGKIIKFRIQSVINIRYKNLKKKYYEALNIILEYYFF